MHLEKYIFKYLQILHDYVFTYLHVATVKIEAYKESK